MNISLKKSERDALAMFLAKATSPGIMAAMGLSISGPEYRVALNLWGELQKVGPFDPDCDDWGGK